MGIQNNYQSFNPRLHAEATLSWRTILTSKKFQSTPPRGRRRQRCRVGRPTQMFNPRLHAGGDKGIVVVCDCSVSIHASTREATASAALGDAQVVSIHASRGRRLFRRRMPYTYTIVSIHASTREAIDAVDSSRVYIFVSIHASTREATAFTQARPPYTGFNPRLHAGGDRYRRRRRA